jgi:hypothetical protein
MLGRLAVVVVVAVAVFETEGVVVASKGFEEGGVVECMLTSSLDSAGEDEAGGGGDVVFDLEKKRDGLRNIMERFGLGF